MDHAAVQNTFGLIPKTGVRVAIAFCIALLAGGSAALVAPTSASAKPEFAAQTGKPCGACHTNPSGGGALKPLGAQFKANGNKMPK